MIFRLVFRKCQKTLTGRRKKDEKSQSCLCYLSARKTSMQCENMSRLMNERFSPPPESIYAIGVPGAAAAIVVVAGYELPYVVAPYIPP